MEKEFKNQIRSVIQEFGDEIVSARIPISSAKPIPFRDDKFKSKIRSAYKVPIDLLRFRKDNGRIASDVLTYENSKGPLREETDYGQSILKRFLEMKDPEPTQELINSLTKDGQDEKAVITSDGFLINGNRRKMALEKLLEQNPGDERYKYLEVIILPGPKDDEPGPTYLEIEQLENRYQYQRTGKAEYYNFDKALSIKRKIDLGMSLEEQLLDDPNFVNLPPNKLKKKLKDFEEEYLKPLECIDRYLAYLKRPGHYNTVSEKTGDKEGRWQAFLDYYKVVYKKLNNDKQRMDLGIEDDEIGYIENAAFKIIRKRELGDNVKKKLHQVMRDFPKLLNNVNSKKELLNLVEIDFDLPKDEITDEDGKQVDEKTKDIIWSNKYASDVIWHVKKAYDILEQKKESDTPIELLQAALDKLNHVNMNISSIEDDRFDDAMKLSRSIQSRSNEIEHLIYNEKKERPKSKKRHK
ncbi:MAG: hypothetical protein AAGA64_14470 [Bacteroidota bacterium]